MRKYVLYDKGSRVEIEDRDVLVGPELSAVLPKNNGKRAEVVPSTHVFDSYNLASEAALKGGALGWVVNRSHDDISVVRARVRVRQNGANSFRRFIVQPVTEGSKPASKGKAYEISTYRANFHAKKADALKEVAAFLEDDLDRAKQDLSDVQRRIRDLESLKRMLRRSRVSIPKGKKR